MATHRRFSPRALRVPALLAALGTAALVAGGCGGSSGGGSSDGATEAPGLAQAQAVVKQATTRPTNITVTQPIDKPIPTGKKVTYISCGVEACNVQAKIIAQGAKDLGWSASTIATDGSPEKLQAAFNTALRDGANAVILNAVNRAAVANQIDEAKRKGVAFVTCDVSSRPRNHRWVSLAA